jgi:3-oxoacyl-[acyl-carrier-protein] synthase-3
MSKVIIGTGSDLPERLVTNDDLEATVDDYDRMRSGSSLHDWVMKRTGVALRHRVAEGEGTSDMAVRAARRALDDAGVAPEELDLIVCSTFTGAGHPHRGRFGAHGPAPVPGADDLR